MRLGKKYNICSEFPGNFLSKSWSNLLDISPYGSFSQVMEQFFGLFMPISPMFGRFRSQLSLTTNPLLENVASNGTKLFNGPDVWCFWMVLLPWDAKNTICLALIGYLVRIWGWFLVVPDFAIFSQFLYFSKFLFQTFLKISQKQLVVWKKLWKHFCSKFTQLSGKLWIVKISCVLPALCLKSQSIFCISLYIVVPAMSLFACYTKKCSYTNFEFILLLFNYVHFNPIFYRALPLAF